MLQRTKYIIPTENKRERYSAHKIRRLTTNATN